MEVVERWFQEIYQAYASQEFQEERIVELADRGRVLVQNFGNDTRIPDEERVPWHYGRKLQKANVIFSGLAPAPKQLKHSPPSHRWTIEQVDKSITDGAERSIPAQVREPLYRVAVGVIPLIDPCAVRKPEVRDFDVRTALDVVAKDARWLPANGDPPVQDLLAELERACNAGAVGRVVAASAKLLPVIARLQLPRSPSRLQVALCFTHVLRMVTGYEDFLEGTTLVNQELNACDASQGPEFEGAASICELRTLARRNLGLGYLYGFYSTAAWRDLIIFDYDRVNKLLVNFYATVPELQTNSDVFASALVALAHMITFGKSYCEEYWFAPDEWLREVDTRRKELLRLVREHFWDAAQDRPDVQALISAARRAFGPWAVNRTFSVLLEELNDWPDVVQYLQRDVEQHGLLFNGPFFYQAP